MEPEFSSIACRRAFRNVIEVPLKTRTSRSSNGTVTGQAELVMDKMAVRVAFNGASLAIGTAYAQ